LGRLVRERFDGAAPSETHVEQGETILRIVRGRGVIGTHAVRHLTATTMLARLATLAGLVADRERDGE
jgi:hypothetical protein